MSDSMRDHLAALARRQHGVIAPFQCRSFATRAAIRHELGSGRWSRICGPVHIVAGAPVTPLALAMARLLRAGPGGAVSHVSALTLWDVIDHGLDPLHVTRVRHANSLRPKADGIVPHESRSMPATHVTIHQGLAVVTPARALVEAASCTPAGRLERWLDKAWSIRIVTYADLASVISDLDRRGRRGVATIRELVESRGPDYVAPASGLESRLSSLFADAGLGRIRRQVGLGGRDWAGRVDFLIERTGVVVEVQSDRYHASLTSTADDERRTRALADAGFRVVEVWESDVWHRPDHAVAAVRAAIARRRAA